ncbi:MAG TPA: glycosyltransferase family 2 protein [Vicinamibacterales bacterium]|nr:glycosyltransferase family 2 protein [Vicinamibacterales bacterium]
MNMDGVFWASTVVILYVYLGYPLLLAVWAHLRPHPTRKARMDDAADSWPSLSIIVAARNEGPRLPGRITNLLELKYPGPREIILVSDGSTDGTLSSLRELLRAKGVNSSAVRLIEVPAGGKPLALNAGVAAATGDILVFADARQRFAVDALVELVANFNDDVVGGVTGELVLDSSSSSGADSTVAEGVGLYWNYEKWMRRKESAIWSTLGATGAIYALRRSLWRPLAADTLLDDVLAPMRAVLLGSRIVFEERAIAFDSVPADAQTESRRKTRTLAGNYQILGQEWKLLLPVVNPVWLQYMSHKVGRLLVPWALLCAFISSMFLARSGWYYVAALTVQVAFYGLALVGGWMEWRERRRPAEFEGMSVPLSKGAR